MNAPRLLRRRTAGSGQHGLAWLVFGLMLAAVVTGGLFLLVRGGLRSLRDRIPGAPPERRARPNINDVDFVALEYSVGERNNTWWRYSWRLELKNKATYPVQLRAEIKFLDDGGFIVDDDQAYGLFLQAGEQHSFTGYKLINASVAPRVTRATVEVGN